MLLRYALSAFASACSVLAADTDTEPTSTTTVRVKSIVTVESFVTVASSGIATSPSKTSTNGLGDFIMEGLGGGGGGGTSSSSAQALPASATIAPFPTKNTTAAVDWQACQTSQISWSDGWTSAFQPELVSTYMTGRYVNTVITLNVTFGHADVYTTIDGIPHAHGEIEPTSVSQYVANYSEPWSAWDTYTTTLDATYLEPSPNCTIAPSQCTGLWQSYLGEQGMPTAVENATEPAITPMPTARPRCSLGPVSEVCEPAGETACVFSARKVEVFYWPQVTAAPNASLAMGNSSAVVTQIVGNITMTSPSVYLIFDHLQAIYTIDGTPDCNWTIPLGAPVGTLTAKGGAPFTSHVGGPYTDAVVSLDPTGLTSLVRDLGPVNTASVVSEIAHGGPSYSYWANVVQGTRRGFYDGYFDQVLTKPVDYADFKVPAAEAYYMNINGAPGCNRLGDHPQCSTIFDGAYRAQLLVPPEARRLRPEWASCHDPLLGALDPPVALTPAASIKVPSKGPEPTPETPKDIPAKETPVDNKPKETTPAIPGPTLPAEPSPTSSPSDKNPDAPEKPVSDDVPSSDEPVLKNPPASNDESASNDQPVSDGTPPSNDKSDPSGQPPSDESSAPDDRPASGQSSDTPSQDPGSDDAETPSQNTSPSSPSNGQNTASGNKNSEDSAQNGPESNEQPTSNDDSTPDNDQASNHSPGNISNNPSSNDANSPAEDNPSQDASSDQNNGPSGEIPNGNVKDDSSGSGNGQSFGGTANNGESSSESSGSNGQGFGSDGNLSDETSDSKTPENALDVLSAAQQENEAKQTASPSVGDAGNGSDYSDDSADAGSNTESNGGSSSSSNDDTIGDSIGGSSGESSGSNGGSNGGANEGSTNEGSSGDTESESSNSGSNRGNNSDDATIQGSDSDNAQSKEDNNGNSPSQSNDEPSAQVVDVDGTKHTVAASNGVPIIDGTSLPADVSHTTIKGQVVSIEDEGVVIGTQTVRLPSEQPTSQEAVFIADGQRFTAAPGNSDGVAVIDGTTLTVGDSATVANGVTVSAASNAIVIDGSTMTYSGAEASGRSAELTLDSITATASQVSTDVFAIGSVTLTAGGSDATISGHTVSAASTGIVVDGESEAETGTGTGSETTQDTQATQSSDSDSQSSDPATSESGASSLGAAASWAVFVGFGMLALV